MLSQAERLSSTFYWAFIGGMTVLLAVPFIVLSFVVGRIDERLFSVGAGLVLGAFVPASGVGLAWLQVAFKKRPWVVALLNAARAQLGGDVTLPSLRWMAVQPRLSTTVSGADVQIVLLRRGAPHGRTWMALVSVAQPFPLRLAVSTPRSFVGTRGAIVGLTKHALGDPRADEAYRFLSDRPDAARAALLAPSVRPLWETIMAQPGQPLLNLSPASRLSEGVTLRLGIGPETPAEQVVELVGTLLELGRRGASAVARTPS